MRWKLGLTLIVLLLLGLVLGVGWYFSNSVLVPRPYSLMPEFEVTAVEEGRVVLPLPDSDNQFDDTLAEGRYGLLWEGGSGELGPAEPQGDGVSRSLTLLSGAPPTAGAPARMDTWLFRRNPEADLGLPYEAVTLSGPVGELEGWWLEQGSDTAVLMLHGRRRGDLAETLRILPTLHDMGYSVLAMNYRNHGESAMSPDGFYHYGASEWEDALAGLEFLAEQGIDNVVLYGLSMGGAVALELLENLPSGAPEISALVLDSPLVDAQSVIAQGARNMGLPLADELTDLALLVARFRAGVSWRDLDQRAFAAQVRQPVLLIAGTADSTVPIDLIDQFAQNLPEVEYRRLNGVEHVEGWNQNPAAYESWVRQFLEQHAPL